MLDSVLVWILAGLAVGGLLAAFDARRRVAMYRRRRYWRRRAREHRTPAWRMHPVTIKYVNGDRLYGFEQINCDTVQAKQFEKN